MNTLKKYIKPKLLSMSLGLFIKFVASMMDLLLPLLLAKIVDDAVPMIFLEGKTEYTIAEMKPIWIFGALMLLCAVLSVCLNITANRMAAYSSGMITKSLRHDLFAKITRLSARNTDKFSLPTLISRLTSDTYNVNQMLARMQRIGVRGPILLIGGIIITLTLDPVLTLVLLAILPVISAIVYFITKKSIPIYTDVQNSLDKTVRIVQENITGIRVIKALSKTEYEKKHYEAANTELSDKEQRAGLIMAITNPSSTLLLNIGLCFVILVGAQRADSGLTQPGTIIAFLSYFTIILNAMIAITRIFILYTKGVASADRIDEVLKTEDDLPIIPSKKVNTPYFISFKNVSFSYNGSEDNLTNISFDIKKGETLGIIGATGSGKTTVINLLLRMYDADSGEILIDGRDVRSLSPAELYTKIGAAFQNDFIFSGTVRENIDFDRGLSDDDINRAVRDARAEEFISSSPEGLSREVSVRGTNLSGGQKQRLLIARALAGNPEILILDDSSSALDYKTDSELRSALYSNYGDTTSIIVAQRVSSILHAEHILVLDDGREIGYGTHGQLLSSCPEYREIYDVQMGGGENA